MYATGSSIRTYGPHEKKRVTSRSAPSSNSAGASSGVAYRSVSVGPRSSILGEYDGMLTPTAARDRPDPRGDSTFGELRDRSYGVMT